MLPTVLALTACASGGRHPTPAQSDTFRVSGPDGVDLVGFDSGPADASDVLLLLHGGPGMGSEYLTGWKDFVDPRFRIIRFDQRGSGTSSAPSGAHFAIADSIADIEAIREQRHVTRWVVAGHSFGGFLAQAYAVAHPDRVSALVIVDGMPNSELWMQRYLDRQRKSEPPSHEPERDTGDDCRAEEARALAHDFADPHSPARAEVERTSTCSRRLQRETFATMDGYDVGSTLGGVRAPVLIINGEDDPIAQDAPLLQHQFRSAQVSTVSIAKARHYPFLEQPDAFFVALNQFLATVR